MRTSGEIDFRLRLKLKITLVESTYPSQRPECPSLSPHFFYAGVMLDAHESLLCSKLCQHNLDNPSTSEFNAEA